MLRLINSPQGLHGERETEAAKANSYTSIGSIPLTHQVSRLPQSSEVETVMIIRDSSASVLDQILNTRSILNFKLEPGPPRHIRDRYLDVSSGTLRRRRVNFRLRETDGSPFLSLKSNAKRTLRGATRRRETEVPWSTEAFDRLVKGLNVGVVLGSFDERSSDFKPIDFIESVGFRIVQDRETRREVRNVSSVDNLSLLLAELAVDHVTYHIGKNDVSIFEIEVEEKTRKSSIATVLSKELIDAYKPSLQNWSHGKLVTGLALQKLLTTEPLESLIDRGQLKPEGVDHLDRAIRSSREFWGWSLLRMLRP